VKIYDPEQKIEIAKGDDESVKNAGKQLDLTQTFMPVGNTLDQTNVTT
jgi:hypothetical protein